MHRMTMGRSLLAGVAFCAAVAWSPQVSAAQEPTAPYTLDEVRRLLGTTAQGDIARLVSQGCITFEMNAIIILELQDLGADDALIEALNAACLGEDRIVTEPLPRDQPTTAAPRRTPTPPSRQRPPPRQEEEPVVESAAVRRSLTGSGFYGSESWFRLDYSTFEQMKSYGATWATMTSGVAEFGLWGAGAQTTTNSPTLGEQVVWEGDVGMSLNLFLLQPSVDRPLGLYLGGLAGFSRGWLEGAFGDGLNSYQLGWEAGAFARVGTDNLTFIPRITRRSARVHVLSDAVTGAISEQTIIMGAEAKLAVLVPGVFVHLSDGTSRTVLAVTFAF